jgi:precorrin-2 dehydrogenase/sirohydrochlorin ferrochelatase
MRRKNSTPPVYYPIFLNLRGKKCVVIGGGHVALRKVKMLLEAGANVFVISRTSHPEITKLSKRKAIHLIQRDYKAGDLKNAVITLACTDVKEVNRKVALEAKKADVMANVADDPERSDFITPSFFKRGNLIVAVSTAGVSPALARKIRTKLEKTFGKEYASLLSLIGEVRSTLKEKGYPVSTETWQEALDLDSLIRLLQSGHRKKAKAILLTKLQAPAPSPTPRGSVS